MLNIILLPWWMPVEQYDDRMYNGKSMLLTNGRVVSQGNWVGDLETGYWGWSGPGQPTHWTAMPVLPKK